LIGKYTVPAFLAASWYATDDPYAERKREWFIAHARGASFRSLDLPIDMTGRWNTSFSSHDLRNGAFSRTVWMFLIANARAIDIAQVEPMMIEEPSQDPSAPPSMWQMMELTNGAQLRTEGTALHHCVASYADRCWRGASRIWALRVHRGEKVRHVLTVEVDMKRRAVVRARGWGNRAASGKPLRLLQDWAVRERMRLAI
jgi:hypothetical protein